MAEPWKARKPASRKPDFLNLLKLLRRQPTDRPVLYELFMNGSLYAKYAGKPADYYAPGRLGEAAQTAHAFANLGYDYFTPFGLSTFGFPRRDRHKEKTVSLNEDPIITDRASFESYAWPDPDKADYLDNDKLTRLVPDGMKLVPTGPSGVLENTIGLLGYENLCMLLADDPQLAQDTFDAVGGRILRHYQICLKMDLVGALMVNDDWGFKTQPMLSPAQMRQYVFPWHKKIVAAAHAADRPAILHSCGNPADIMEDVIEDMRLDGRHSYEDTIVPPEQAWPRWGKRISIMGGIDLDFLCRSTPEQVYRRARMLVEQTRAGGWAVGSGNSIPEFIPEENYLAMVAAAYE